MRKNSAIPHVRVLSELAQQIAQLDVQVETFDDDVRSRGELLEEFRCVAYTVPEESLTVRDIADMLTIAYRAAARTAPEGPDRPERPALRVVR
ncbi:hypothetical protein [Mycolicibacterium porcinum]|uniref:hypothetical protein n=1 Tax=Mycolicibacterium porcinum TaxID=39693 RepID=UPI0008486388|nr:hypothetical protein [Mycolicibacterium porcinum]ODR17594.1 hypothetical protein BHQ19_28565 [Mycolicibacterium porcinum]